MALFSISVPINLRISLILRISTLFLLGVITSGCRADMRDQPRLEAFEESAFFSDGAAARPRVADTVARQRSASVGLLRSDGVKEVTAGQFPLEVTQQFVERGRERYNIFCSPCHGVAGDGTGLMVEYGMRQPTSFHDPDLVAEPHDYYFRLITDGTRVMPSYAASVAPDDRWAIIAYIRALQFSQNADVAQLSAEDLRMLNSPQ